MYREDELRMAQFAADNAAQCLRDGWAAAALYWGRVCATRRRSARKLSQPTVEPTPFEDFDDK